ncbi:hypothetical protein kac65v162_gp067 [Nodularia phage vB_NspS-kac65v162]|uniref:Uncharacterized protein n=1 Tax=Nodularia phage vB_NspS-kac65v162 TaxID=2557581 RepID=A0A482MHQ9_9CAUD|nr:hypothetical protein kac65v162_gp067 [Nodularia phage vB_NspS-kac65v162]
MQIDNGVEPNKAVMRAIAVNHIKRMMPKRKEV